MPRSEEANRRIREARRTKILEGARRAFARKGMATTMAEVAAEASVSQGLAYRYFESKEEIFRALAEQVMGPAFETMRRIPKMPGTPGERLDFLFAMLLGGRREDPEFFQLLYHVLNDEATPEDLRKRIDEQGRAFQGVLRGLIVEGQASGEVAEGDPDQLVTLVMVWLDGLSRLALRDPERYEEHLPHAELFLRVFGPDSVRKGGTNEPPEQARRGDGPSDA